MTESRYSNFDGHPLQRVPQEVLDVAREEMHEMNVWEKWYDPRTDSDKMDSIADAWVLTLARYFRVEYGGPLRTKTGKILTDADIEALADEAERGYDVSHLKPRPVKGSSRWDRFREAFWKWASR